MHNLTYRLRLDNSIVSMSIMWICLNPIRARFLSSSHPRPPAPTTSTRQWSRSICRLSVDGSKSGRQNGPDLSNTFRKLLHRRCVWSELIIGAGSTVRAADWNRNRDNSVNEASLDEASRRMLVSSIYFLLPFFPSPFVISFSRAQISSSCVFEIQFSFFLQQLYVKHFSSSFVDSLSMTVITVVYAVAWPIYNFALSIFVAFLFAIR